ncbi:MAG TPA: sugar phosphate nucleotidyltransferase [Candidatus Binataceae bacterium]
MARASGAGRASPSASALIIAGGRGSRFWPASRELRPKPLFSVDGKESLLAATISRLRPLIPRERVFVLVAAAHAAAFRAEVRGLIPARNLIVEPDARGTAVAIAYGSAVIRRRAGDGIVAVMPADHLIAPAAGFRRTLKDAIGLAHRHDSIVVIGITPSRAEPGLGYQEIGAAVGVGFKVASFVEKPALALARTMVRSGKVLWNAGMFVMSNRTLDASLRAHSPRLADAAQRIAAMPPSRLARAYRRLNFDSFDKVVIEKSADVLGVRARFRWHDVGSWEGLWEATGDKLGNVARGNVIALQSERYLAHSDSRLMVLFGVKDIVAVDTGDALLIAHRSRSQDVRRVTDELRRRRLHKYL